jgi:vacuolar protein sorting-associated protein 35
MPKKQQAQARGRFLEDGSSAGGTVSVQDSDAERGGAAEVGVPPEGAAADAGAGAALEAVVEQTADERLTSQLASVEASCETMKKFMSRGAHDDVLATAQEMLAPMSSEFSIAMYAKLHARCSLHLRLLEAYLVKAASKGHGRPVVELYQRVQCCNALLPRLYLLVTLGCVCIKMRAVSPKSILQDVAEMCHGVHHTVRGLFLRAFTVQMYRDKMPATSDAAAFLLESFRETNKLWLRLNAETTEESREAQAAEFNQMRDVVTVHFARLRGLRGFGPEIYRSAVLPVVQEQIVNARDPALQEGLFCSFVRTFGDYHLATLSVLIQTLDWLHPDTKAEAILRVVMDAISEAATRAGAAEVPADSECLTVLTQHVEAIIQRRSLGTDEKLLSGAALIRMSVACFPGDHKFVEEAIANCVSKLAQDGGDDSALKHSEQIVTMISAAVSGKGAVEILGLDSVTALNDQLLPAAQAQVAAALCSGLISSETALDSAAVVEQVFRYLQPLIAADDAEAAAEKSLSEEEVRGQQLLGAVISQLRTDDLDLLFKLYVGTRKMFARGGQARVKYTLPALVTGGAQLATALAAKPQGVQVTSKKAWGFCHQTCSELKKQGHQALALRLFLTCAQGAGAMRGLESVSLEFISQALTILQEPTRAWALGAAAGGGYASSAEGERSEALVLCCGAVQALTADADAERRGLGLNAEHGAAAIATCTTVAKEVGSHKGLTACAYLHATAAAAVAGVASEGGEAGEAQRSVGMELLEAALGFDSEPQQKKGDSSSTTTTSSSDSLAKSLDVLNALVYLAERGSKPAVAKVAELLPKLTAAEANEGSKISPVRHVHTVMAWL